MKYLDIVLYVVMHLSDDEDMMGRAVVYKLKGMLSLEVSIIC